MRGASSADPTVPSQAAVSILESHLPIAAAPVTTTTRDLPGMNEAEFSQQVYGIARFVQIAPKSILMDLTVRVPSKHPFDVYVSSSGNVVDPPTSTGAPLVNLGRIVPDKDGYGDLFKEVDGELWEWVGRACVVEAKGQTGPGSVFAGVVARSSGVWGNDKTVCACSGRTMWEEGREMEAKGML